MASCWEREVSLGKKKKSLLPFLGSEWRGPVWVCVYVGEYKWASSHGTASCANYFFLGKHSWKKRWRDRRRGRPRWKEIKFGLFVPTDSPQSAALCRSRTHSLGSLLWWEEMMHWHTLTPQHPLKCPRANTMTPIVRSSWPLSSPCRKKESKVLHGHAAAAVNNNSIKHCGCINRATVTSDSIFCPGGPKIISHADLWLQTRPAASEPGLNFKESLPDSWRVIYTCVMSSECKVHDLTRLYLLSSLFLLCTVISDWCVIASSYLRVSCEKNMLRTLIGV